MHLGQRDYKGKLENLILIRSLLGSYLGAIGIPALKFLYPPWMLKASYLVVDLSSSYLVPVADVGP